MPAEVITVQVAWTQSGKTTRRPVEGWESGVLGLVIVREPNRPGYQLVHQASGCLMVGRIQSRRKATLRAEELRDERDWSRGLEELRAELEARGAVEVSDVR